MSKGQRSIETTDERIVVTDYDGDIIDVQTFDRFVSVKATTDGSTVYVHLTPRQARKLGHQLIKWTV